MAHRSFKQNHLKIAALAVVLILVTTTGLALAAATFTSIVFNGCSGGNCTVTAVVSAMSNPDKQVCLQHATADWTGRCTGDTSGAATTIQCTCTGASCGDGVGTWTCSFPGSNPSSVYWMLGSWTAGGGGNCGNLTTFPPSGCGTVSPLAVTLAAFTAEATPDGVTLAWETVSEMDNAGFNIYRAGSEAGAWVKLTPALIPAAAPGSSEGHAYTWSDATAAPGAAYWYQLEDVAFDGTLTRHAPVQVEAAAAPNAVGLAGPLVATSSVGGPALAGLAALALLALTGAGLRRQR